MRDTVPMKNATKQATIEEWIQVVGIDNALKRLWDAGMGVSTAEKIATGRYGNVKFRRRSVEAIKKALANDGFVWVAAQKAS